MAQTLQDNVKAMIAAGVPEADIAAFVQKYDASQTPSPASLPIKTSTPAPSERSWGDTARSAKDTAAEFLPSAGATIGSIGGVPGRLLGYAGGQGYQELLQRGGELPGAIADIYRNLRDGDPNVRFATLKGAVQGAAQGTGNLIPGGRGTQAAVSSLQADKPYTAAAEGIGAALDAATVGSAGAIRKVFTNTPGRATLGTLLGLGGAKIGEGVGGVVADEMELTPDQRVFAETVGSIPGFAIGTGLAHPRTTALAKEIAMSPITHGLVSGGATLASTGSIPGAIAAALSPSGIRVAKEFNANRRESNVIKKEQIASRERMQGIGIGAKKESAAVKRQEVLLDAATKRRQVLSDAVSKTQSIKDRDILLAAQKAASAQVNREYDVILNDRKIVRENELSKNASAERKAVAEGKLAEAERIREDRKTIVERHRAQDRAYRTSDLIDKNAREDIHIADRVAAQDFRIHEANIKEQTRAIDLRSARAAANKTRRDIAYSKILSLRQKNLLIAESNKATAAKQAELRRGMVGKLPIVRESTRLKRDGVTTTTDQLFNYPEELASETAPVVDAGQISVVPEAIGAAAPQPRVRKAAIFEEMDNRATTEQAGMFPNRMGARAVELAQDIARDRENRITEWTGENGKPTGVDPKISELERLLEIMTGTMSPASVQGRFVQGGTGNIGANK